MDKHEFIQRVAAGLRSLRFTPSFLLIHTNKFADWEFDDSMLCGLLVFKSHISSNKGYDGIEYPISLCYASLSEKDIEFETHNFQKNFTEYQTTQEVER